MNRSDVLHGPLTLTITLPSIECLKRALVFRDRVWASGSLPPVRHRPANPTSGLSIPGPVRFGPRPNAGRLARSG